MRYWLITLPLALAQAGLAAQAPATQAPATQAPAAQPSGDQAPLTLAQAIAAALQTNPRLAEARAGVSSARAQRRAARAAGMPNVDLNVVGQRQEPVTTIGRAVLSPVPGVPPTIVQDLLNGPYLVQPQISGTFPLYTGGRVSAQKRAASRAQRAAELRVAAESQRLVLDVASAYLDVLEARRQAQLTGALRQLNEERLKVARVRQGAGVALPLETSQAESDLAQSIQSEIDADARSRQAAANLNVLVGRRASTPLVLADLPETAPDAPVPGPSTAAPTPERLHELGLDRPDIQALREDVRRTEAQVDIARAARRPQVTIIGNYLRRIPETLLGGFGWALGGSIVQSLFDGGRARAQIESARADRDRANAVLSEGERRADADVERARITVDAAEKRLAADQLRVAAATAALEVARTRLRAGTAAPVEVTESETVLARAQTDALTSRFELARARVQLAFAAGVAYPESIPGMAVLTSRQ